MCVYIYIYIYTHSTCVQRRLGSSAATLGRRPEPSPMEGGGEALRGHTYYYYHHYYYYYFDHYYCYYYYYYYYYYCYYCYYVYAHIYTRHNPMEGGGAVADQERPAET